MIEILYIDVDDGVVLTLGNALYQYITPDLFWKPIWAFNLQHSFKMNTAQNDAPIMMSVAFCITSFIFHPILFASRHGWGCVTINQSLFRTCFSWNTTPCANKHTFRQSSILFNQVGASNDSFANRRSVMVIYEPGSHW